MSSSRCSKLAVAALLVCAVFAGSAAAVSLDGDAPNSAKIGVQQESEFTITEPFSGEYNQWTLRGQTELTNVSWVVTTYDNTGAQIDRTVLNGQTFGYDLDAADGVTKVTVHLTGTTPDVADDAWSYDPPQTFDYATFVRAQDGGSSKVIESIDDVRPYTDQSEEARTQIRQAEKAIERAQSAGADTSGMEKRLQNAVSAYGAGNFGNAIDIATQVQDEAGSAASSQQTQQWLLIGGVIVVVLLLLAGGVWWYLNQRDTYDRLG